MKTNDIVVFKNPHADELWHDGRPIAMRVIENNGTRLLVEVLVSMTINPTKVVATDEVVRVFKEFTNIPIPRILDTPDWIDVSWGNDATARMERVLPDDCPYELTVWVEPKKRSERESRKDDRFSVVISDRKTGDELEGESTEQEKQCAKMIKGMMWKINLILENGRRNADAS